MVCPECGEEFLTFEDAEKVEEKAMQVYRERKGLLSPQEIKSIRNKYNMSQVMFSRVLGLGEKTVTRYENGYLPELAQSNLIRLVDNYNCFCTLWNLRKGEFTEIEQKKMELQLQKLQGKNEMVSSYEEEGANEHNRTSLFLEKTSDESMTVLGNKFSDFVFDWYELKNELICKNRYFPKNKLLKNIKPLFQQIVVDIPVAKDVTFYRAREKDMMHLSYKRQKDVTDLSCEDELIDHWLYNFLQEDLGNTTTCALIKRLKEKYPNSLRIKSMENGFYGYDEENSGAPVIPNTIQHGRANPEMISYLYLAEDPETAIAEISPIPSMWISVGLFKITQALKLIDLSGRYVSKCSSDYKELFSQMSQTFSLVAKNKSDYYITQYVSEYIKSLGYDGIIYSSSICSKKINIVLFYDEKVRAVGSELYEVEAVKTTSHRKFPLERF